MSQSFIHQVGILFFNFWVLTFEFLTYESQSFIHQVRILSGRCALGSFLPEAVAILYSSSQNSLLGLHQRCLWVFQPFEVAILYSSSQNSLKVRRFRRNSVGRYCRNPLFIKSEFSRKYDDLGNRPGMATPKVAILYSSSQNSLGKWS